MGRINIYLVVFLFCSFCLKAQTQITGNVTTFSGESLPGASVILKDLEGKILKFALTDREGNYSMLLEEVGSYVLEANFLGFVKQFFDFELVNNQKSFVKNFVLEESSEMLQGVVIEVENPVQRRGDTLIYSAKAFATGHEQVVEDLLKNIPGIAVEKDGRIIYEDKEVEKVMIEGDDFFNRGYSLLTKNMPSQPLDKVEILRNYSNNKLLKGVENSDKVALNLTIEDKFKNIWFGNLSLGYDVSLQSNYETSGNLMSFSKKVKHFFTFAMNNIGVDKVGNIDGMFYNTTDIETVGQGSKAMQIMLLSGGGTPLKDHRTRFNNVEMLSLNSIFPINEKIKLKLSGFLGFDETDTFKNSYSVTDLANIHFENSENQNFRSYLKKGYLNLFMTYDISKTQMLQTSSLFNQGGVDDKNNLTFNTVSTLEKLETKNVFFDQKLTYTHKWKERNVAILKSRFFSNELPQYYQINDYLLGDLFAYDNLSSIDNTIENHKQYVGIEADFKLKQKKGNLLEFKVGYEHNIDELQTNFRLFTDDVILTPDDFQAKNKYNTGNLYLKSGYNMKFSKFSLGSTFGIHQLFNVYETENHSKKQAPIFINPYFNAGYEINTKSNLTAYYNYNKSNINHILVNVNETFLLTSSRGFSKGLNDFDQTVNTSTGIRFSNRHFLNRYQISVGIEYSKQNDVVSSRSTIEQNSSLSERFMLKGGDRYNIYANSHWVIRPLKGSIKLGARLTQSTYFNQINNSELRENIYLNQDYVFEWRSSFKSLFNFHLGTEWSLSRVTSENVYKYADNFTFLDLLFNMTDNFDFKIQSEYYQFSNKSQTNPSYYFMDLEAVYKIKQDKYSFSLKAKNLFDTKEFTVYRANDIGYSTTSYRLLPRYVLASFTFRF